jgi:Flp pilus assembly protein TadD
MAADRLDEAEEQLTRGLDLSPDNPSILAALGQINQQRQRFAEAVFYYKRALALAPDDPRCLNQLAILLAADGRFDEAAAVLEKLGQLLPASPTVSYNLACLYGRRDQPDKAIGHLQKALEKGYDDWQTLRSDPDLESIRQTPFYINLINSLEQGAHDRP